MTAILVTVFILSTALCFYTYVLYLPVLSLLGKLFAKKPHAVQEETRLRVAVVVPAYNEEAVIAKKITNIFAMNYPAELLSVWVGSDCSSDATEKIVTALNNPAVHLWCAPRRGGKTQVLNLLTPQIDADIILFTDANTMHDANCLKNLVRHFADPTVGGVAGTIAHLGVVGRDAAEVVYRSLETRLKQGESALHSAIAGFGGCYTIRKSLFTAIPYNAYSNDDVMIPMNIIRQGYRFLFEPEAKNSEDTTGSLRQEFGRRIRIGAGNAQAFFWLLDFLNPLRGWPWFCYVSHKALRWFSPFLLLAAFVAPIIGAFTTALPAFRMISALYGAGLIVAITAPLTKAKFAKNIVYFLSMNAALALGFFRYCAGIRSAAWSPTDRVDADK